MKKYALINNAVVTQIVEIDEQDFHTYSRDNNMVIDITDASPVPQVGWVLNGNQLEFPIGISDREKMEIQLNKNKREFGTSLSNISIDRIGARNKILMKTGPQVTELLTHLMGVKALLETGALGTARYSCTQ